MKKALEEGGAGVRFMVSFKSAELNILKKIRIMKQQYKEVIRWEGSYI